MKNTILKSLVILASLTAFASAQAEDRLGYGEDNNRGSLVDVADYEGQTFLKFMQDVVKPQIDAIATEGYVVAEGSVVKEALGNVDEKVAEAAIRAAGGKKNLIELADELNASGETYTLYTLPDAVGGSDRYTLATFLGLASGGGVAVKFNEDNYAYNIHYGTGDERDDERTGRSFGASASRGANDASDWAYLTDLQKYAEGKKVSALYRVIIEVLTTCDVSGYADVSDFGTSVLTDFLAVYIAEQDRNLMQSPAGTELKPWWDASLLEVTLLSYFHSGQKEKWIMYVTPPPADWVEETTQKFNDYMEACMDKGTSKKDCQRQATSVDGLKPYQGDVVFTNQTFKQESGGVVISEPNAKVSMTDYWQKSTSVNPMHSNRSGINITKPAFRALGTEITNYERNQNPELVKEIEKHFPKNLRGGNVYAELSEFLIDYETGLDLKEGEGQALAEAFEAFLDQVNKDAQDITEVIKENPRYDKNQFEIFQ